MISPVAVGETQKTFYEAPTPGRRFGATLVRAVVSPLAGWWNRV